MSLTLEQARETVTLCNGLINNPETQKQIEQAKTMAAGNPMMLMMSLMPIAITALAPTLSKYGFPADQNGIMQFFTAVKVHEEDPEIKALADEMREKMLSPELITLLQMMQAQMAPPAAAGPTPGEAPALD